MGLFPATQYGTYVQKGQYIDYTNSTGSDIPAGTPIDLGTFVGVTLHDMPATTPNFTGSLALKGVFDVIKADAGTFAIGVWVGWDNVNHCAINAAEIGAYTDSATMGKCVKAALSTDQTVRVLLNPYALAVTG